MALFFSSHVGKSIHRTFYMKFAQVYLNSSRCTSIVSINFPKNCTVQNIKFANHKVQNGDHPRSKHTGICDSYHFRIATLNHKRSFTTSKSMLKKKKKATKRTTPPPEDTDEDFEKSILEDPDFNRLREGVDDLSIRKYLSGSVSQIGTIVLQPWVKWGPRMKQNTSAQLMLEEAATLVSTLPGVKVVAKEVVPVKSLDGKMIFGSGTLARLVSEARSNRLAVSVFISIDMLKRSQIQELEAAFGMKVWDRYSVVLGIFQHNAHTREAKLQVALAELPYIRKRLPGERERMIIMEREKRIRNALNKLAGNRALIRRGRSRSNLPTVAIVGYTNSGKTSLIRSITGDERAEGKNSLFATLDVTAHGGRLPCGLEVAFIDTVGFIQDIPTELVASFRATLEDAVCADVVIHVRDASHPDYELQGITVNETLSSLPLSEDTPVITVANKADLTLVKPENEFGEHMLSATTGQGIPEFLDYLQEVVLKVTGRRSWRFSLPTGSPEIQWLRNVAGIVSEEMDPENLQVTKIVAVLTDQELAVYNRNFGKS